MILPSLVLALGGWLSPHGTPPPPAPANAFSTASGRAVSAPDVARLSGEVRSWRKRFLENGGSEWGAASLIRDLDRAYREDPAARRVVILSLLDLGSAGLERRFQRDPAGAFNPGERGLLGDVDRSLRAKLVDEEMRDFVSREVLLVASRHPAPRRAAAARHFATRRESSALLALLQCANSEEALLRTATLEALVGWENDLVHRAMVKRLRAFSKEGGTPLAELHFQQSSVAAESQAEARLAGFVKRAVTSRSWREASLAVSVSRALPSKTAAPILITGLAVWVRRGKESGGTLRTQNEIATALKRISGRNLGLRPDRWQIWWRAVAAGDTQLAEAGTRLDPTPYTSAGFFGLDPKSDRVTFVLDRSGSMDTPFRPSTRTNDSGPTRYEEAIDQLCGFVDSLGENGRFSVVLFSDRTSTWRTHLQVASKANQKSVRKWLSTRSPEGGTMLREGVHRAFRIDRKGQLDLEELEADTLVVLCDGATTEGSGWVSGFLKRNNHQARVRFHCVQIGRGGDGTLEKLAEETGGDFRRIDR